MRRLVLLASLLALPATAAERQVPMRCDGGAVLAWSNAQFGLDYDRTPEVGYFGSTTSCEAANADIVTEGDPFSRAVAHPDAHDPTALWVSRLEREGQLHVRVWPDPPDLGVDYLREDYVNSRAYLDVVAGRTYRLDRVLRKSAVVSKNSVYVQVHCPRNGLFRTHLDWQPEDWTIAGLTTTETCSITFGTACQQPVVSGEAPAQGLCHNDLIAYERAAASCGIGPELALLALVLRRRFRHAG